MNVANLQIEGLLVAIASINSALVQKGVLSVDEIDRALRTAEANAIGDDHVSEDLSPSHRDAVCFPIRILALANLGRSSSQLQSFSELTRQVGRTKEPYNDQL